MATSSGLSVVFMGTPDFSVPALQALLASHHKVIAVYSQPARPKGRGQQVQVSPVQAVADAAGVPVYTPISLKKDAAAVEQFSNLKADVAIVAAYGLILPQTVLSAPRYGCLNIHASLLPRWRGASPIQHAIWHGDAESGVTIMQMEAGLDTGPMIEKQTVPITPIMTSQMLHDELSRLGGAMIVPLLDRLQRDGVLAHQLQDEALSNYAPLLKKEDGRIDWTQSSVQIDRQIRALNPWPGTMTALPNGTRLKVLEGRSEDTICNDPPGTVLDKNGLIACGMKSTYRLLTVQPENSKAMTASAAANGGYLVPSQILGAVKS